VGIWNFAYFCEKCVMPHMPSEHAELTQFFDTVEKLFTIYQVPADVQAKLLIPILSSQAETIIGRMTSDDLMSYDKVKQFLLTEFRLTPNEYNVRFYTASKNVIKTYVLFASRLGNLLSYYLRSRGVEDFATLCEPLCVNCWWVTSWNLVYHLEHWTMSCPYRAMTGSTPPRLLA